MKNRATSRRYRKVPLDMHAVFLVEERIEINNDLARKGWTDWDTDTGVVYFIQAEDGPIKVGYSSNPIKQRFSALQSTNAKRLTLLATLAGTRGLEQRLHSVFKQGRIHGEWFKPDTVGLQNLIAWAQERIV